MNFWINKRGWQWNLGWVFVHLLLGEGHTSPRASSRDQRRPLEKQLSHCPSLREVSCFSPRHCTAPGYLAWEHRGNSPVSSSLMPQECQYCRWAPLHLTHYADSGAWTQDIRLVQQVLWPAEPSYQSWSLLFSNDFHCLEEGAERSSGL